MSSVKPLVHALAKGDEKGDDKSPQDPNIHTYSFTGRMSWILSSILIIASSYLLATYTLPSALSSPLFQYSDHISTLMLVNPMLFKQPQAQRQELYIRYDGITDPSEVDDAEQTFMHIWVKMLFPTITLFIKIFPTLFNECAKCYKQKKHKGSSKAITELQKFVKTIKPLFLVSSPQVNAPEMTRIIYFKSLSPLRKKIRTLSQWHIGYVFATVVEMMAVLGLIYFAFGACWTHQQLQKKIPSKFYAIIEVPEETFTAYVELFLPMVYIVRALVIIVNYGCLFVSLCGFVEFCYLCYKLIQDGKGDYATFDKKFQLKEDKKSLPKKFKDIYDELVKGFNNQREAATKKFTEEIIASIMVSDEKTETILRLEQLNVFCQEKIKESSTSQESYGALKELLWHRQYLQNFIAFDIEIPQSVLGFLSINVSQFSDKVRNSYPEVDFMK